MTKKQRKMSITLSGDVLGAWRSSAGYFQSISDVAGPSHQNPSAESHKLSLTLGQTNSILGAIDEIFSGPKYPSKSGREYLGLCELRNQIVIEKKRQFG